MANFFAPREKSEAVHEMDLPWLEVFFFLSLRIFSPTPWIENLENRNTDRK